MINIIFFNRFLKTIENRVQAYASMDSLIGFIFVLLQQVFFIILVKSIHDLVGKTYKAINIIDRRLEIFMQKADSGGKRCTVSFCNYLAAFMAYFMKQLDHVL